MLPFFLFWFVVAGVYGLRWLFCLIVFLCGHFGKSVGVARFGAVALGLWTLVGVLVVLSFFLPEHPVDTYETAFGSPPTPDVVNLQCQEDGFGDSDSSYLKFQASPATIKKITAKGWKRETGPELEMGDISPTDDGPPSWWHPISSKTTVVYDAEKRLGQFSNEENEVLIYDTATHWAYYNYFGFD